jgi:hypothetical protein
MANQAEQFEVRPITVAERETAIDVCNRAFGFGVEGKPHFGRDWPYVWNDEHIADTWAAFEGDTMVGVVGAYKMTVRMGGETFRSCCLGQVGTPEEYRGRGVMSSILRRVTAVIDAECDFAWLGGDRMRYGRYGWAWGGTYHSCHTNAKYLPEALDESAVRAMDPERDGDMLREAVERMPFGINFDRKQFSQLLSINDVGGVMTDDAWVLFRGPLKRAGVSLGDGNPEAVAGLLAYLSQKATDEENPEGRIWFEAPPYDCSLARVALAHYATMERRSVGGFRLGDLQGYFERACHVVEPTLCGGSDELSLRNTDTGQTVRIQCADGKLSVDDKVGANVRELTTTQLSEAAFSPLPLDVVVPGLAANSPLRTVLRMPVYLPFSFYAM